MERRILGRSFALPLLSGLVGLVGWIGWTPLLALSLAYPILWAESKSRREAWFVALAYYAGATQGLIVGCTVFFDLGIFGGALLWGGGALLHSLIWVIAWTHDRGRRCWFLPIALLLAAIPPIGTIGWAHPLTAAGIIFPGWALWGVGLTWVVLSLMPLWRAKAARYSLAAALVASVIANVRYEEPSIVGWTGFITKNRNNANSPDFEETFRQQMEMIRLTNRAGGVCVFPEGSGGDWNEITERLWQSELRRDDAIAVLGPTIGLYKKETYDNAFVAVTKAGSRILYKQRMPSPVSMWKPWAVDSCVAHWFEQPVFDLAGKRAAGLICHEQFLVWPILHSFTHDPQIIVATGNVWWAHGTTLPALQNAICTAWARSAGVPLVKAFNR